MLNFTSIQLKCNHEISLKLYAVLYNLSAHIYTLFHSDMKLWGGTKGVWMNLMKQIPHLPKILKQEINKTYF